MHTHTYLGLGTASEAGPGGAGAGIEDDGLVEEGGRRGRGGGGILLAGFVAHILCGDGGEAGERRINKQQSGMKDRSQTLMKQEQQQRKESGRIRYWHVMCSKKAGQA